MRCHIMWRKYKKCQQKASQKKESYVNATSVVIFRGWLTLMCTRYGLMDMNVKKRVYFRG